MQRAGMSSALREPAEESETFAPQWDTRAEERAEERGRRPALLPDAGVTEEALRGVSWSSTWRERCVTSPQADPGLVEQFRRLAAVMNNAQATGGMRVVMLTSAAQADGKTSTALNLSLVLSESFHRSVLLVDADLRRPSLGELLQLAELPGLGEALKAKKDTKLSVVRLSPNLLMLPGGRPDPDPMSGLTSPRMRQIMEEARERFDWVIIDSPPMEPTADAQFLSELVDGIVFVIRAGHTQFPQVEKAVNALGRDRIIGVILNGVEALPGERYSYYGSRS